MTTTAFDDQFTAEPEHVTHRAYDTAAILRKNVADLERELQRQRERHAAATARLRDQIERVTSEWERAEAELKAAREQKPVRWHVRGNYFHDGDAAILFASMNSMCGAKIDRLFAAPVPVPAVPDANPVQWLEDEGDNILVPRGLLGAACSAIENKRQADKVLAALRHYTQSAAPAVPDGDDFNGTTPHMVRCIEALVAMNDRGALAPHGLCRHSRTLLLASANRLRQQQAHVVPAVPVGDGWFYPDGEEAIRTSAPSVPKEWLKCWLIERPASSEWPAIWLTITTDGRRWVSEGGTMYATGGDWCFTSAASEALKFADKESADEYVRHNKIKDVVVTEHIFDDRALLQSDMTDHTDCINLTPDVPAPEFRTSTKNSGV